jgi:hypothetical protein
MSDMLNNLSKKTKSIIKALLSVCFYMYYIPKEFIQYHLNKPSKDAVRVQVAGVGRMATHVWPGLLKFLEPYKHGRTPCEFIKFYKPDVLFFSVFGNKNKMINSKIKYKIFWGHENTETNPLYHDYYGNCVDFVALSIGYNFLSSETPDNYIRFPDWPLYYFSVTDTKDDINRKLSDFSLKYAKTKFCTLITRHDPAGIRKSIYDLVCTIAPIDCPGKFMHNDNSLYKHFNNEKFAYLRQYKFNICPENTISPGYVSEKIFHAFYAGSIPIYISPNKNPEPGIINPNAVLFFEPDSDNTELLKEIKRLHEDENYYTAFMAQPVFADSAVDKIFDALQAFNARFMEIIINIIKEKNIRDK